MEIVGVPYGAGAVIQGCEKAPKIILEQLKSLWSSENNQQLKYSSKIIKLSQDYKSDFETISKTRGDIFLGGDHSITYPLVKSKFSSKDGMIVFDAHPDCYQMYDFPTHGDWLYHLVNEGIVNGENIVLVGVRNSTKQEIDFIRKNRIRVSFMKDILFNINEVCDNIMEIARKFSSLYLSIDVDSLDPAFAPGTGFQEPGGFTTRELLYMLQRISHLKNIARIDITEVNPVLDINDVTSKLAAKITAELLNRE